ncbi:hypothetical protein [Streptomyces sp. Tu 6176]|uniref:hypothetical protein n=1 Tax=Streptomyces sp. Tu 6176 TaxID=1470557 RepID=UPI001F3E6C76|nr:hypothetical protein [Streptomyces sp. Tu 6176]
MDRDDEQSLRRRVYGADHDAPDPGPLPHRTYAELVGGPLDGLLLDIHGWQTEEVDTGAALITGLSRWPGAALYMTRRELPLLLFRRHALTTQTGPSGWPGPRRPPGPTAPGSTFHRSAGRACPM